MSLEIVQTVAIIAAVAGAAFQVWNSTPDGPTPISRSKLIKSIISAGLASAALVNLSSLAIPDGVSLTWVGIIVTQLFVGAGVSRAFDHK